MRVGDDLVRGDDAVVEEHLDQRRLLAGQQHGGKRACLRLAGWRSRVHLHVEPRYLSDLHPPATIWPSRSWPAWYGPAGRAATRSTWSMIRTS
jgi:hypothetical protein